VDSQTRLYEDAGLYQDAAGTLHGSGRGVSHGFHAGHSHLHTVQFYEDDQVFVEGLSQYIGSALGAGGACVVIATAAHRERVAERLTAWGIDLRIAARSNRYIALDAEETLAQFMVGGWPNEQLFWNTIEPALLRAQGMIRSKATSVVVFGEMVALLWAEGKREAAVRLEQMWNDLARRQPFSLRCAYPMGCFRNRAEDRLFRQMCGEHSAVVPAESYTLLGGEDARLRMVSSLQQKAQTLEAVVEEREREIAQRKRVEERLRRSEEFASTIVENSLDCVYVLDLDGRIAYISPPGQRALEIGDMSQLPGRRWTDFWKEEDQGRAEAALAAARWGGTGGFQGDCATPGGILKSWDVRITAARGSDGEVEQLIVVAHDITELKRAQMAVIQSEKLAAAGRLAATIAHEINNPLEAVTNYIYLAKTSPGVPEEVCRQLEIADQELARVAQIAQQTLGFYRDGSQYRWVDVAEVMRDVMTLYERKARYKRLETEVSADGELKLYARQGELRQALGNLIANAIDASRDGGKLWLRAQPTKNWTNGMEAGVRITLADNGSGMAPEVQRQIFVPFFTTKADVGTGIGLWVTKNLIEKQGGYMRFRSRQGAGAGTVMSLFLPVKREGGAGCGAARQVKDGVKAD